MTRERQMNGMPKRMLWEIALFVVCLVLLVASLYNAIRSAHAQEPPPFLLNLPNGTTAEACEAQYDSAGKVFTFEPCNTVFNNGFEGP